MATVFPTVKDAVSVADLDRGLTGRILQEVRETGAKVVMKDDAVECVLLSPANYARLVDELEDAKLYALAMERMSRYDPSQTVSQEDVDARLGITKEDLAGWEDIELE